MDGHDMTKIKQLHTPSGVRKLSRAARRGRAALFFDGDCGAPVWRSAFSATSEADGSQRWLAALGMTPSRLRQAAHREKQATWTRGVDAVLGTMHGAGGSGSRRTQQVWLGGGGGIVIGCRPGISYASPMVEVLDVEMRTKGWQVDKAAVETWNKERSPEEGRGSAPLPRLAVRTKQSRRVPMKGGPEGERWICRWGASSAPATRG